MKRVQGELECRQRKAFACSFLQEQGTKIFYGTSDIRSVKLEHFLNKVLSRFYVFSEERSRHYLLQIHLRTCASFVLLLFVAS